MDTDELIECFIIQALDLGYDVREIETYLDYIENLLSVEENIDKFEAWLCGYNLKE